MSSGPAVTWNRFIEYGGTTPQIDHDQKAGGILLMLVAMTEIPKERRAGLLHVLICYVEYSDS